MLKQVERTQPKWDQIIAIREVKCINGSYHDVKIIKYGDGSIWICCPSFGWYEDHHSLELGCKSRKKQCTWFFSI